MREQKTGGESAPGNPMLTPPGPPEKKKKRPKYLLIGVPNIRECSDHPRMAALDLRIRRAAKTIEEKYGSAGRYL